MTKDFYLFKQYNYGVFMGIRVEKKDVVFGVITGAFVQERI
ncbi:MAG: hypothetical protein ACTSRW_15110 [Candidatus Helarchaeota archaeon]